MNPLLRIPERKKRPGVCYAVTDDGVELPVIDLTDPAFAALPGPAEQDEAVRRHLALRARHGRLPGVVRDAIGWLMHRGSRLARAVRDPERAYVPGLPTYLLKLGPGNLGDGYAGRIDRLIAGSAPALSTRLRLRNVATLLAEALVPRLGARPGRPLVLVNIGGGPATDSLNALLLVRRDNPRLLDERTVHIHVLDVDPTGPSFGARALGALTEEGRPLRGLAASLRYHRYDWTHPETLETLAAEWGRGEALVGCSSEGALFDYGADDVVVANLEAMRRLFPEDTAVVGSFARSSELSRALQSNGPLRHTHPRTEEHLTALVGKAGWQPARVIENLMTFDVRLRTAGNPPSGPVTRPCR